MAPFDPTQTIEEEAGLPEHWRVVDVEPIMPGVPPAPNGDTPRGSYYSGAISPAMQHDATLVASRYGNGVPRNAMMPLPPAANAQINSTVKSVIESSSSSSTVVSTGMIFRGTWNSFSLYNVNDVVIFNKSAYVALQASVNVQPNGDVDPPQWQLLGENLYFNPALTPTVTGFWGPYDKETNSFGTGTTISAGPITPTVSTEGALWVIGTQNGGVATPPGWSVLDDSSSSGTIMNAFVLPVSSTFTATAPVGSTTWATALLLFYTSKTTFTAAVTETAVDNSNTVTVTCNNNFIVGTQVICSGLTNLSSLNGVALTVATATPTQFTAAYTHAQHNAAPDTGTATNVGIVQTANYSPGNINNPSLTFTNPVTPGNTVVVLLAGHDSGGFGTGHADITSVSGDITSANSWTIINSNNSSGAHPNANVAFIQSVTGGQTVQTNVVASTQGSRYVILELAQGAFSVTTYLPYDVVAFSGSLYVCLNKTSTGPSGDPTSWYLLVDHTFTAITSGTNTQAAMLVGSGASLDTTGTGFIDANKLMTTDLRTTGGAHDVLKQSTLGGVITVAPISASDLPPIWNVATKTTTYAAVAQDYILGDTSGGGFTVTLPAASANAGQMIGIKKKSSDSNTLTIGRTGSDTIDGATSQTLVVQYNTMIFLSDGTNWYII